MFEVDQSELLQALIEQIRILNESKAAKDAQIAALTEQVAKLAARIEELTRKKNSNNSSKPPSERQLEQPAPKSLRGKTGKKQGGQPGHKGTGMKLDRKPAHIEEHVPVGITGSKQYSAGVFALVNTLLIVGYVSV